MKKAEDPTKLLEKGRAGIIFINRLRVMLKKTMPAVIYYSVVSLENLKEAGFSDEDGLYFRKPELAETLVKKIFNNT